MRQKGERTLRTTDFELFYLSTYRISHSGSTQLKCKKQNRKAYYTATAQSGLNNRVSPSSPASERFAQRIENQSQAPYNGSVYARREKYGKVQSAIRGSIIMGTFLFPIRPSSHEKKDDPGVNASRRSGYLKTRMLRFYRPCPIKTP